MLLKPIIAEVLQEVGLVKVNGKSAARFSSILNEHGLSLEETAERLRELADSGEPNVRLRTNELVIKAHGALIPEGAEIPSINFIMQSDNINLLQILTPR